MKTKKQFEYLADDDSVLVKIPELADDYFCILVDYLMEKKYFMESDAMIEAAEFLRDERLYDIDIKILEVPA